MFNKNPPPWHKRNTLKLLYYYVCGLFEWLWVVLSPLSNGNKLHWLRLCVSSRQYSKISTLFCTLGLSTILWENSSTQLNSTLNYVLIMQAVKRPNISSNYLSELPNKWSQTLMPVIILLLRWSPHIDFTEFGGDHLASFKLLKGVGCI